MHIKMPIISPVSEDSTFYLNIGVNRNVSLPINPNIFTLFSFLST